MTGCGEAKNTADRIWVYIMARADIGSENAKQRILSKPFDRLRSFCPHAL